MNKPLTVKLAVRHALWLAALAVLPVTSTPAQQAGDVVEMEEVIVTGTSIRRVAEEGALPVQMITQEDIVRSGVTSVTDLMQNLPVMQGYTSIADSVGGGGGGVTTASLHDVGDAYTLVLLNGRRVAPSNSGTTIDLNSIPLSAIERVEVLTDGASAIYGADAIAGVVNFILKQGEAPLTLDARVSKTQHGGGGQYNIAVSKGFGSQKTDGYQVFLAASYDKQSQLKASQREFAKTGILSGQASDNLYYDFFNGSSRSIPPNVDVFGTGIGGVSSSGKLKNSYSFSPYLLANGDCPANHVAIGDQCYFDYTSSIEIAPELKRAAVYGSGKLALGDSGWTAFSDLAYTDVSTVARIAPYPAEFSLSTSSPLFTTYVAPYLTSAQLAVLTSVNVKYRLYELGNRTNDYHTKALHVVAGAEGKVAGWDASAAMTWSTQVQDEDYLSGYPLADAFQQLIDSGSFNPFAYTLGSMPASQVAALKATQYTGNYQTTSIKMVGADANIQKSLFKLAGGDAVLSLGADARDNGYKKDPNDAVANAEILFDDPQTAFDFSRTSVGFYGEALLPVADKFEVTTAVRHDLISGVTDHATGGTKYGSSESATTYKIGGKWQPAKTMALRASYGTGFRVASMREIAQPKIDWGVTSGTYDCPFSSSYDPLGYYAAGYICADGSQFEQFQGGNPKLKPERSQQWNIGWVWEPSNVFSTGINYWAVNIKDAVSSVSEQLVLDNPSKYLSLYTTKYKSSNGQTYVAILDAPINIGRMENQGIDWDFSFVKTLGFGTLTGKVAGTYLLKSRYTVPGTDNEWTTSLNKFGVNDAVSFRQIITASAILKHDMFEHTVTGRYRTGYTDQAYSYDDCVFYTVDANGDFEDCSAGALKVPAYIVADWRTAWQVMDKLQLVFGIQNFMDKEPPLSLRVNGAGHQLGYDPRYADAYGRTYVMSAKLTF